MTAALYAEWTKLRTLAGTAWLLLATIVLTIGISVAIVAATHQSSARGGSQDPTKLALTGIDLGQAAIAVLAVLVISEEYGTGMVRTTLVAMPHRLIMLAAKAANLAALTLVAAVIAVAGCLIAGRFLFPTSGIDPAHGYALISIAEATTLRAAVGSVIYLILIALLALGIATAVRDTAVSIGVVLALLYMPPLLAQAVSDPFRRLIQQIGPMTAGMSIQATVNLHDLPIDPLAGLGVLAAWAAAALLLGGLLLHRCDA
jgi:ABC-2 type transport system permease protein